MYTSYIYARTQGYIHTYTCKYAYIHGERETERERDREQGTHENK